VFIITLVFYTIMALGIYFLPTGIACNRAHPHVGAIFALNILLGWTLIGWAGALVWALINSGGGPIRITRDAGL
jgi:hypothetical protein